MSAGRYASELRPWLMLPSDHQCGVLKWPSPSRSMPKYSLPSSSELLSLAHHLGRVYFKK